MQILFHVSFDFESKALTSYFRQAVRYPVMKWSTLSPLSSWHREDFPTACDWEAILKTYFPKLNSVGRFGHWHDRKSSLFRGSDQSEADSEIKTVSYKW